MIYDIGVAPGMSNLLAATAALEVAPARQIRILVGGLPVVRRQPWEYAAPFSPADVMEEYVRPARIKIGGKTTERPALSGIELLELPELGTLEAFYTDGLRSLLFNLDCPSMEEKTLRYPGYAKRIGLLRDSGFLGTEKIDINGVEMAPIDLTLKLLEPAWHLDDMMEEFTVMRVEATGGNGRPFNRMVWELFDRTDRDRKETSMAPHHGVPRRSRGPQAPGRIPDSRPRRSRPGEPGRRHRLRRGSPRAAQGPRGRLQADNQLK